MRSTLFIAPTIPQFDYGNGPVDDQRYHLLRQFAPAVPTYGNQYLLHGEPTSPIPGNATLTLHDGTVDWHWGDLLTGHPALQALILFAHWREADGFHIGTKAQMTLRGANVLQTYLTDAPPHMWFGDPP